MADLRKVYLLSTLISFVFLYSGKSYSQGFKASVIKKDITPDRYLWLPAYGGGRQSTGVHDRIHHRIVILDDGNSQFLLVSSELVFISPSEYDRVASLLKEKHGIEPSHFWWSTTHTHSTPGVGPNGLISTINEVNKENWDVESDTAYTSMVVDKLIRGVGEAKSQLQAARLGVGWGYSRANINRRALSEDGRSTLGMNPDGPVDRRIGILKIMERSDDNLLALIANYPIHGTVLNGENTLISGDAPGIVSEYVEAQTGATLIFINGAAGNLAPIYSTYPSPQAGHLSQFKALLGDEILKAKQNITANRDSISLKFGILTLRTPKKSGPEWPTGLSDYIDTDILGDSLINLPIRFLKIDKDIGIWSAPLELFCEISNEVREQSPFPYTFYYGYTNGWLGYMPTKRSFKRGGYEPSVSPYMPSAGKELEKAVSAYLQGELKSK